MEPDVALAIDELRAALPDLRAVYLFGSAAADVLREDSDIDLAVLAGRPMTLRDRLELGARCALRLYREVDLVDLFNATPVLLRQVLESGRLVYARSEPEVAQFETTALSRYCAWNEERRGLIDDILTRGSIYAR